MNKILLTSVAIAVAIIGWLLFTLYPTGVADTQEFRTDLFKIILEVGLLGLLAVLIKFLIDEHNSKKRLREESLTGLLNSRLDSYKDLWMITAFCNCSSQESRCEVNDQKEKSDPRCRFQTKKGDIYKEMRSWYFDQGNGVYLSHKSKSIYDEIKDLEKDEKMIVDLFQKNNDIDVLLSRLRSSLKHDCGIYDEQELKKRTGKK